MSRIVVRYLNREVLVTMLVITAILLFIFMANQFVRYLGDAAQGHMTGHAVLQMMSIQIPLLTGFMLPLGLYLAILLTYGRLYADSEMTVLFSCGLSRGQLVGITLLGASVVSVAVAVLMIWVEPQMAWYRDHILAEAAVASPIEKLAPGRFQMIGGQYVVYAGHLSRDRSQMQDVFTAQLPDPKTHTPWTVLSAKSAKQVTLPTTGDNFIEFQQGYRYTGMPGERALRVIEYGKYGMRIPSPHISMRRLEEFFTTAELWHVAHLNPVAAAELQWRFSMPLSVLILALLAVPLSRVRPRQGRFAGLLPAILLYIVYIDLLFVSRAWLEKDLISAWIGLWWVHGLMLLLAGCIYAWQSGRLKRLPREAK